MKILMIWIVILALLLLSAAVSSPANLSPFQQGKPALSQELRDEDALMDRIVEDILIYVNTFDWKEHPNMEEFDKAYKDVSGHVAKEYLEKKYGYKHCEYFVGIYIQQKINVDTKEIIAVRPKKLVIELVGKADPDIVPDYILEINLLP